MKFIFNFPVVKQQLSGVYRLVFDGAEFYIGCSKNLRARYNGWASDFRTGRGLNAKIAERISTCPIVIMEEMELCSESELKQREAFYLKKYAHDPLLLSWSEYAWEPVLQYDKAGNFIKKHSSIGEAARVNCVKLSKVQNVLNGVRTAHQGMVFVYEKPRPPKVVLAGLPKKNNKVKIIQKDLDGNVIALYDTYEAATKAVGCSRRNIARVILGEQKTAAGYVWACE